MIPPGDHTGRSTEKPQRVDDLGFQRTLRAARDGDQHAFAVLFEETAPRIRAFLHARGAHEPDDLTNEVFIKVHKSLHKFKGSQPGFVAWVFQIARNALIDDHRKRLRRPVIDGDISRRFEPEDSPIDHWHDRDSAMRRVQELLAHLTDDQAEVFVLRVLNGLSYEEISTLTSRRIDTVRQLYRRARIALEAVLELEAIRDGRRRPSAPPAGPA